MALKNTCPTVIAVETIRELRRYSQNSREAPEPPCACASAVVDSPRTRLNAPRVGCTGSHEVGSENKAWLLENAVRSIQYNGKSVIIMKKISVVQAASRPQWMFRGRCGAVVSPAMGSAIAACVVICVSL